MRFGYFRKLPLALLDLQSSISSRVALSAVGLADRRAAVVVLGSVLVYGFVMQRLSGVPVGALVGVVLMFEPLATATILFVALVALALWIVRPETRDRIESRLFWLLVAGSMAWLTFPLFGMFKQVVLPLRGFLWDRSLAHIGRMLLGISPWQITHQLFGSLPATRFLDSIYSLWLILIFVFPMVVAVAVGEPRVRFRLIFSWFAAWVLIGTLAAWVFASAGPVYYNALVGHDANYAALQLRLAGLERLAVAQGRPLAALQFQPILLDAFRLRNYAPAGGISAMPSMHVALATLLVIGGFRRNRLWGGLLAIYALLIWIASIHFGWHYFIDGPVAALMMVGLWKATAPLAARLYPEPSSAITAVHGELSPLPSPPHLRNFFEST